jgi:predicted AAA+ superfamily ATPase
VGSPIVVSNLAQDLQVAPKTVKHWLEVLERMYLIFLVRPYTRNLPRAVLKPPKAYFFDNADVLGDEGARFENLVATHLLKHCHFLEDSTGDRWELSYLRDKEGREVDFVLLRDGELVQLVEAKWSDADPSSALTYYCNKLKPRAGGRQLVARLRRAHGSGGLRVIDAAPALSTLSLPLE